MTTTTKWANKDKVLRRFRKLPAIVQKELRADFEKGAAALTKDMKRRAPKKSGALRATTLWRWGSSKKVKYAFGATGQSDGLSIVVSSGGQANGFDVRYAHLVEFGSAPHPQGGRFKGTMHPGTPANPFFFVTYRAKRRSLRNGRRRAFRKAIAASSGA